MQIHVVKTGDTLNKIAQAYGISAREIADVNQITDQSRLVVGQTFVIPINGQFHWVQPGESLWLISRRYKVSAEEIVRINKISNPNNIPVGLRLYLPQKMKQNVKISAYIDPRMTRVRSAESVDKVGEYLSYLAIFSYAVNRDGTGPFRMHPVANSPSLLVRKELSGSHSVTV